jgi:hypothetical protein
MNLEYSQSVDLVVSFEESIGNGLKNLNFTLEKFPEVYIKTIFLNWGKYLKVFIRPFVFDSSST